MINALNRVPTPENESVLGYLPGSPERASLDAELARRLGEELDIPLIIDGEEIRTGDLGECVCPHDHAHVLARYHKGGAGHVTRATEAAARAHHDWSRWPWEARVAVFLKAAELLAGKYRPILNAATMLGQSKTAHQAEIDSACELIDFYRFNPHYAVQLMTDQPQSSRGCWNYVDHRPLEGFVFAVTPFNFTSIAGNLPTAPAMMGNTVLWKPASSAVYSGYFIMRLLMEAGLPPGVINFIPGSGGEVGDLMVLHKDTRFICFTGSMEVGLRINELAAKTSPGQKWIKRVVNEMGGKDTIVVDAGVDIDDAAAGIVAAAFGFQGQKCSACSRVVSHESL